MPTTPLPLIRFLILALIAFNGAVPLPAEALTKLIDKGQEIGSLEFSRTGLAEVEAEVGELDPVWVYAESLGREHISAGKIALLPKGTMIPVNIVKDTGLEEGKPVEITESAPGAVDSTVTRQGVLLDWATEEQDGVRLVSRLQVGLSLDAVPGTVCEVRLKLLKPIQGVILPLAAIQRNEPPAKGAWVYHRTPAGIERSAVTLGQQAGDRIEVITGALPGEKFLAGDLRELHTRFQLPRVAETTATATTAPIVDGDALNKRLWSKFLWACAATSVVVAVLVAMALRSSRRRPRSPWDSTPD